ncbi:uncharacterized protein TNCV_5061071 [Trichonephila clavipes]|nr:uncharacterized protein TNCV_5061071 [Trichonephila clavipes]
MRVKVSESSLAAVKCCFNSARSTGKGDLASHMKKTQIVKLGLLDGHLVSGLLKSATRRIHWCGRCSSRSIHIIAKSPKRMLTSLYRQHFAKSSPLNHHYNVRNGVVIEYYKFYHRINTTEVQRSVAAVAEWYRYRIVACLVTSSIPVPLKTRRVGQRCTLNLSRVETSSRWCGVVVRRGGASSGVVHVT